MNLLTNDRRAIGVRGLWQGPEFRPGVDVRNVSRLLAKRPAAGPTPLVDADAIADRAGVASHGLKDDRARMGLGSFKALGAAYAIAVDAQQTGASDWSAELSGAVYVSARAGNHGPFVAAGARVFGTTAVIFLAEPVSEAFAHRLRANGARVARASATYEESKAAAAEAAQRNGRILLSDSSWPGHVDLPRQVIEGYLQMIAEVVETIPEPPTHVFLHAGVIGMAAAVAASWLETTPSGGAGVAVLLAAGPLRNRPRLTADSRVPAFLTEGLEAP